MNVRQPTLEEDWQTRIIGNKKTHGEELQSLSKKIGINFNKLDQRMKSLFKKK